MTGKRNLAHRMGRWSGTHPWTAILGWLAFVVISFVAIPAFVTTNTLDESELGVGESGRAAKVLDRAFPTSLTPAGEMILVQTTSGRSGDRRPERRGHVMCARASAVSPRSPTCSPRSVPRTAARRSSTSTSGATRRRRPTRSPRSRRPWPQVAADHPDLRVEQFGDASAGEGVRRQARRGLPEGRVPLHPGHADHPAAGVRRAARRRHPRAARPDLGVHGLRPDRRLEPVHRDRREHADPDDADRHGRRRRLLALLPQARARGARARHSASSPPSRQQRPRAATRCSSRA